MDHERPRRGGIVREGFAPSTFTAIAIAAVVLLGAIVVTGGLVRLTGSGLGCDDWPNCNGDRFVDVSSTHSAIEQVNRLFTFLVGIGVLLAALAAWFRRPRRRDLVILGTIILAGVPAQGIVGAIVVWTDLHPATVQLHFVLSMVLVWAAVLLLVRSRPAEQRVTLPATVAGVRIVGVLTVIVVLLGTVVTATGPHAGDAEARRFFGSVDDIDGAALQWVTRIHGAAVWVTLAAALWLARQMRREPNRGALEAPLTAWMATAVAQGGIGYLQYATGLPVALVALHLVGATTLIGVTAWMWDRTTGPTR